MEEKESQKAEPCRACSADGRQMKDQGKHSLHVTSLDDAECLRSKELFSTLNSHTPNSKSSRNIPRRHTVGGPRSSKEILGMQTSEMDRKREAFLEHLKQKYPHHATAIMGHQERLRDQTRSPKPSQSPQPNLGDQTEHLSEASADSLEAMSEGDSPTPFSRGSRTRASLPVVRSANQTKERSLGVLYLQYGDETKQLRMPNEITSTDTIRALFVSAFPQQLTMKMLESPSVAIYIKDESRNIYYELCDVRNIQDRSFLKVYNKDPAHAFNHTSRAVNGDIRMQREIAYTGRDGPSASRPGSATHPSHVMPSSPPSTPVPHSMPPSPSRIPYGGGRPMGVPGNATIPRDRLSSVPASRSISPSPSAILERRDVKPDEDMSNKNLALIRNEGLYGDPYLFHEGRMSVAAPHTGHPLDVPDHIVAYHRSAMRSSSTYCNPSMPPEMLEQSLYRQKPRKYPESHLPTLSSKTPPASPHRVADMRMIDIHPHHSAHVPPHAIQPDRSSPSRQSFKKEPGPPVFVDTKVRSALGLPGMAEVVPSPVDKQAFGYGSPAMPKDKETSEKMMLKIVSSKNSIDATGAANLSGGKNTVATVESAVIHHPAGASSMQVSLHGMKRNVSDLRLQLHQMKQLQLQNQEMLRAMVKKAELEINGKMIETVKRLEDPVQRQRNLVEQERQKYLNEEERIVKKLCELEGFVEDLKRDSTASNKTVTLKDVEDGAFLLRQVGEAVATLKGEFPTLQNKMRAILRIEVEAVRFLKEEPHKLDSLLKRVRSMTDILTMLRRHVTEGLLRGVDPSQAVQYSTMEKATATEALKSQEEPKHAQGHAQQNLTAVTSESQKAEKKWEEKRQNLDHYNGKEFEKLLEEAQANIMKSIPNLEMPPQPAVLPKGDTVEKPEVSEDVPDADQDNDKLTKSPPPPPPRRSYLPGTGLTTTRSGEVIYAARKEAAAVKECSEDAGQVAQSKTPKEDQTLSRNTGLAVASAVKDEEEEEGDKIMAELQVYGATTGSPTDSDHPKEKREGKTDEELGSDSSSTDDSKIGFSVNDSPTFSKGLFVDSRDYSKKNLQSTSTNLSGASLPEDEKRRGAQDILGSHFPAVELGKQNLGYGLSRDACQGLPQGEAPQSTGRRVPVSSVAPLPRHPPEAAGPPPSSQEQEAPAANSQVVLRPRVARSNSLEEMDSPASSPSEDSPPPENIAFMITKTAVQVLSSGEVHDIVSRKGGDVQTVNIDARKDVASEKGVPESTEGEEPVVCLDKKPVIIIFDEPMDIRSAYKRLSTIFEECDEELEKMMTEEKIEEEEEEEDNEVRGISKSQKEELPVLNDRKAIAEYSAAHGLSEQYVFSLQPSSDTADAKSPAEQESTKTNFSKYSQMYGLHTEANSDSADQFGSRQDSKKKFKFKFPKKQLAALTQAIRTGTKTGKKTLQVVVYEEEEEDGTLKQHKEAKRFEITRSQPEDTDRSPPGKQEAPPGAAVPLSRTDEIRQNTYRTLDSLEQTIKQLENTISEMSPKPIPESTYSSEGSTVPFSAQIVPETPPRELVVLDESPAAVEPPAPIPATARKVP
ncbi:sickle tail protein homolog isoform X3 [Aythya fuligula]|uniref:Sickle tail protein homolog isoform X3 n=1 Tax=Aythya fuligula TaxID=219594 RepID=A0A6J3CCS7_AYTFU|nr:sickle tail protein homolog isoform X3 [Aythya fuligula]